jgi:hypothetical protein
MSKKPSARRSSPRSVAPAAVTDGTPAPRTPRAVVTFLADWQEHRDSDPTAGGRLVLAYDPARLAPGRDARPAVVGYARFLPGGQLRTAALSGPAAEPGLAGDGPAHLAAADIVVPEDAEMVELWFEGTDGNGPRWDSRFGQNYRFSIAPAAPAATGAAVAPERAPAADLASAPAEAPATVALRRGARRAPAAVRVLADGAVKQNEFESRPGYPSAASDLQTYLHVTARIRDADETTNVYADVHVLDRDGGLLQTATLPLRHDSGPADVDARFVLDAPVYKGTVATPGSVSPRPDARAVEYRLYAETDGRLRTDGLVHRCELKSDSGSAYEPTRADG